MLLNQNKFFLVTLIFSVIPFSVQSDDLVESLKAGKFGGNFRLRFEDVVDDSKAAGFTDADALTSRIALHYTSGDFYKTYFHIEFENVIALTDDDDYNDGTNGLTAFPAIVDPEGTEVNQGYIGIKPFNKTEIKLGRQVITPRKAPFHRFLGNVLWRQNWSTQDAVTITNTSLPDTKILAGYIWNNNFINESDRDLQAPIFVIQGSNDTRCPARQMQVYEEKLGKLNREIQIHWFDAGHGSYQNEQQIEHQELKLRFAYRVLG